MQFPDDSGYVSDDGCLVKKSPCFGSDLFMRRKGIAKVSRGGDRGDRGLLESVSLEFFGRR